MFINLIIHFFRVHSLNLFTVNLLECFTPVVKRAKNSKEEISKVMSLSNFIFHMAVS